MKELQGRLRGLTRSFHPMVDDAISFNRVGIAPRFAVLASRCARG